MLIDSGQPEHLRMYSVYRSKTLLNLPLKESASSGPFFFGSLTIEESEISACGTPDEGVFANADNHRCEDDYRCSSFFYRVCT